MSSGNDSTGGYKFFRADHSDIFDRGFLVDKQRSAFACIEYPYVSHMSLMCNGSE